jgi:putative intracellular protease/amidase
MIDTERSTGYWLGEVSHFYLIAAEHGYAIDVVSPRGGRPPLDSKSAAPRDAANRAFLADATAMGKLNASLRPDQLDPSEYAAIYFAGGHGAMWDFPDDPGLNRLAEAIAGHGVVSAVCHGSAGLLNLRRPDGGLLIAGRKVSGFANLEERLIRLTGNVPFLLEDRLRAAGGVYSRALLPFVPHVAVDGDLISGQNPQSARAVARAVVKRLAERGSPLARQR